MASPSPRKATDRAAASTVAKLLIVLSVIFVRVNLGRRRIADPSGYIADQLALTDSEAAALAAPVARMANTSPLGSRLIGPVVRNEDVLAAVLVAYDYQHRVTQALRDLPSQGGNAFGPQVQPRPVVDVKVNDPKPATGAPAPAEPDPADPGVDLSAYAAQPSSVAFDAFGNLAGEI